MNYSKMAEAIEKVCKSENIKSMYDSSAAFQIEKWSNMYRNKAPWIDNKKIFSMNLPASISSEIARLITIESKIEVSGSARATFINEQITKVIDKLRIYTEYGVAKGGLIFKPYATPQGLNIQIIQADSFFPISYDDMGNISQVAFVEQFKKDNFVYTRIEIHSIQGDNLIIKNRAYRSQSESILGSEINLKEVEQWSILSYETKIGNVDGPSFGYYKFAQASTEFDTSPIGASCFSNATSLIREADRRYSSECWEFEAKEAAVNISNSMLVHDKETDTYKVPEGKERLYRKFNFDTGAVDKPFIDTYSPDIRQEAYSKGINDQLRKIEFACSLAYGTLSDPANVDKTAEEIKASKQRSYSMIVDNQKSLQAALEDLVKAINMYASLYYLSPPGNYEAKFDWDDSIITDSDKERIQDAQDVQMQLMQPWEYRVKWYGETETQAKAMLKDMDSGLGIEDE